MLYAGLDLSRKRLDFHFARWCGSDRRGWCRAAGCGRLVGPDATIRSAARTDPRGDRVDERRPVCARSARAGGLAGRDRGCAEGERAGTVGVQDRPHRRVGASRTGAAGSGAGDLASGPARPCRARACALAPTPRASPIEPEAARARGAARAREALPGLRSVRRSWPPAARAARPARAVARNDRGQPASDRRARPGDRRLRARAAPPWRRPPIRAAALHRPGNQLGPRLHDRRRDRRHRPLCEPTQVGRLQRPLPTCLPIRRA
jgi:hypothetical protein